MQQKSSGGVSGNLLTTRELAEVTGLKPGTILDWWEAGKLDDCAYQWVQGGAVRFDLDKFLATGRRPGAGGEAPATPTKRPALEVVSGLPATPYQGGEDA
jgi:hypothetical protein